ncbi:hydantoinase/oxoprolinase family protein [Chloroflexota bacterium]
MKGAATLGTTMRATLAARRTDDDMYRLVCATNPAVKGESLNMKYVVGVDIGGTFTDIVCLDEEGEVMVKKVPSTPTDPSLAMWDGISKLASDLGKNMNEFLRDVLRICHGTTVSTNTILTRSGAKVGQLCTNGFRDILEIRRGIRENSYDYTIPQPPALAPRYLRVPIEERIKWNGEEVTSLNEDEVRKACKYLKQQGAEAVAVCFIWAFKNPSHERRAVEICKEELVEAYVCGSCDVQPEIGEYWRMSTTVINAYVGPALSRYVKHLVYSLREAGFTGDLLITQSNAGVISAEVACEQAVRTVLSGPACAPAAAAYLTKPLNITNLITIDMGGTSFDVCLIKEGAPIAALESKVAGVYHMRLPVIDIHTIGAGGGSIAWLDSLNVLHVGPQTAGADPGPVCYGKGATEPTVTDVDLVLGYLNPDYFLGGEISLKVNLAEMAIKEKIADPLGIDVFEAARSIKAIAEHHMVDEISAVSVQRGEDIRRYVLITAGGAGAVHAASLAKELGISQIVIPHLSSIFCALGGVIADLRHDFVKSVIVRTSSADLSKLRDIFDEMNGKGDEYLDREGIASEDRYFKASMDMRYKSQFYQVGVPISPDELTTEGMKQVVERFHQKHESLYAYRDVVDTEIINLRLAAYGKVVVPSRREQPFVAKDASKHLKTRRKVFFEEAGKFVTAPIYDGDALECGNVIEGPAIVEQKTTTIVVPPETRLESTSYLDYLMYLSVGT